MPVGGTVAPVLVVRGDPAQLLVTIATPAPNREPRADWVAVARSSVTSGERVPVQAHVSGHVAWSAAPAGCGVFGDAEAAQTWWSATGRTVCTLSPTAMDGGGIQVLVRTRGDGFLYPLRVAPGGRHLVDQRGTPFLIKGETAWLALVNLDDAEQERYLADRAAKGFNVTEVMLLNHDYTSPPSPVPPANRHGEQPFLRPGDFSTPDDAYFDRAVSFVRRAAAHGIVVLLAPLYLGFDGGHEGWWAELSGPANTREVCAAYGAYLGRKFKDSPNLLWLAGGDFAPPTGSEGEARYLEIMRGIRAAGAAQLWTGHWNFNHLGGISTDEARFADRMDLNGIYQYAAPYQYASRAWTVSPPRPTFLLESAYEHEHPNSKLQPFRKAWWWSMVSGASGVLWSNNYIWMSEAARGPHAATYQGDDGTVSTWAAELDSPGTYEALHLHAFFEAIRWYRLVPCGVASGAPEIVRSGQGSGEDRIVAAVSAENDVAVVYVPPDGTRARRFSLDLSRFRSPARARWYDPSTGAFLTAASPVAARSVEFETPGPNGSRVNDWVLLLDHP